MKIFLIVLQLTSIIWSSVDDNQVGVGEDGNVEEDSDVGVGEGWKEQDDDAGAEEDLVM